MKKIIALVLSISALMGMAAFSTSAATDNIKTNDIIISETVEYFSDGSSIVITVSESSNSGMLRAAATTKSGAKTYTAKDSGGAVMWKFTVNGTFSYNGVSATCTGTSYSTGSLASGWSLKSASTYASGNKAIGDATFQKKVLLIVTNTQSCNVTLTCDANGNLS